MRRLRAAAAAALTVLLGAVFAVALPASDARALYTGALSGFDPTFIIADSQMFQTSMSWTHPEIQSFLQTQGAACTAGQDGSPCLKDARFDVPDFPASAYCDALAGGTNEQASSIVTRVADACNINPRVLLVMLQKEQGLVTTVNPTARTYGQAMGFRCPDYQTCDPQYAGFVNQVYYAASRLQQYRLQPGSFRFAVNGVYDVSFSPVAGCGTTRLIMRSQATAALYNYTPFTPNQAALESQNGNACSAFGNRNFFATYVRWFGSPTSGGTPTTPSRFLDVSAASTPFVSEINWVAGQAITTGFTDGTFRPTDSVTRAAMAAFLYRLSGSPAYTPPSAAAFPDVPPSDLFYREVSWLVARGVTTGYADGTYRPQDPVTRDAMAAFLYRLAGSPAYAPPAASPFSDVATSHPFYREICWLWASGISTGFVDGTFRPQDPVHRDAMAAFLTRWAT